MQWFKHDSDAIQDAKLRKLIMKYGAEGYAIYFHCIELIMGDINESNITFELEHDAEIVADNLRIRGDSTTSGIEKVNQIMRYIVSLGLFNESRGKIYCYKILKRLDTSMTSNGRLRSMITTAKKNHDAVMIESCHDHDSVMKEENRREQIRTEQKKYIAREEQFEDEQFEDPTPAPKPERRTVKPSEVDAFLAAWNAAKVLPPHRGTRANLGSEAPAVFDAMSLYTPAEISEALANYVTLKSDLTTYKPWNYPTPISFLKKGIPHHLNQSAPLVVFAIQKPRGAKPTPPTTPKPTPRVCPLCGAKENTQLSAAGQPWCHDCHGWNFDTQEAL